MLLEVRTERVLGALESRSR